MPKEAGAIAWDPCAADQTVSAPTFAAVTFDHAKTTSPTTVTQNLLPRETMLCPAPPAMGIA